MWIRSSCREPPPNHHHHHLQKPAVILAKRIHRTRPRPRSLVGKCVTACHHPPLHLFNTDASVNFHWKNRFEEAAALSIPAFHRFTGFVSGGAPFARFTCPTCHPPPSTVRERQSLAGTAGCPGNALCHRSGLEQEAAYPCQSAGRIWARPCVNR